MKMRLINKIFGLLIILMMISCGGGEQHAVHSEYTCPMHPTVVSEKPATCPVCGMDLVKKAGPGEEIKITGELRQLIESPVRSVVSSIKTITPTYSALPFSINATGTITYDPRNVFSVSSRISGRIEKMHVTSEFQQVQKGQVVAEIYSPELISAQRELVYLIEHDSNNDLLIEAAKKKLKLLGIKANEIDAIVSGRRVLQTIPVYSPYVGFLISENVDAETNTKTTGAGTMSGMNDSPLPRRATKGQLLREGDYVNAGQTLVNLVNNRSLLVELDIPAEHSKLIQVGSNIQINFADGKEHQGEVVFVQPYFTDGKNFLNVRLYVKESDLRVGQFVRARLHLEGSDKVWIPREAVISLGNSDVVFIKERNVFKPRNITTGIRAGEHVEIVAGLATSDVIAFNAAFMVDSDSFIKQEP